MRLCLGDVVDATGARLVRGERATELASVGTDTRSLVPGELFLALRGPSFDGNRFARQAQERGARALLLRDEPEAGTTTSIPLALHPDPRRALIDLAAWHRARLDVPVIGITGSAGKTTTKEILTRLLRTRFSVVASPRSFNNAIGVPLTLLQAGAGTQALVVELGTNHPGEIAELCRIARPTAGIVTNVGHAHLDGLGSLAGVAREKAALFAAVPHTGFCVLNLDSRHADVLCAAARARTITLSVEGVGAEAGELNATELGFHPGGTTFRLGRRLVRSPLLGVHNVTNLLCALAACHGLGLELEELLPAVAQLAAAPHRLERAYSGGVEVIDDTYNANPESVRAALRVLCADPGASIGRRVLVLGDMLELGARAPELHHELGREAARAGIELLLLVGELTRATAAGALEEGMVAERVVHLGPYSGGAQDARASDEIVRALRPGDRVLFKASRAVGLETAVERVLAGAAIGKGA
jgi:UDP-N-acetylmuramoyl-tripeptide--D-alanyl-D-alanine ligase